MALREGERLGPYLLERKIAVGGMAEVWSAHLADAPEKRYAIKILLEVFVRDPVLRTMFLDEVRIAKRLRHPNIVRVETEQEANGLLFQAMELIEGKDLRRILAGCAKAKARIPVPLAAMIAREVARGLGYAHQARSQEGAPLDIVHRDVSPHNIMIDRDGGVRVLDFGVARARERMTQTQAGVIKGKVSYMSPEQMMAEPVTAQADVFSLGIVLWEMLAMRRLFGSASDAEVFAAVCEARVPPIGGLVPGLPPALVELVHRMLALRPKDRPESMREVENALTRVLATHFPEGAASAAALAALVEPFLDAPRKKTAVLVVPVLDPSGAAPALASAPTPVTPGPAVPAIEPDGPAARTEAIPIGTSFADAARDDLQDTLRGGAPAEGGDLLDTVSEPYLEPPLPVTPRDLADSAPMAPTMPYSTERRQELAETVAIRPEAPDATLPLPPVSPAAPLPVVAPPARGDGSLPPEALSRPRPSLADLPAPPAQPGVLGPAPPAPKSGSGVLVLSGILVAAGAALLLFRMCGG